MTVAFILLSLINPAVIDEYLETLLVDYRFKIRNVFSPPAVPENILIVTIDEQSLSEYGRWPWDRMLQAELIEKVFAGKPMAVGLDIFYPERETPDADQALANVFAKYKDRLVVALGFEVIPGKTFEGELPEVLYDMAIGKVESQKYMMPISASRSLLPHEPLGGSARYGHVYSIPDMDGRLRLESTFIQYGSEFLPSLGLHVATLAKGLGPADLSILGGIGIGLGDTVIPTDEFGRLQINYFGKEGSIRHISAAAVLSDALDRNLFKDKIVFIGTSAIATYDMKTTPFSANMPGVEKNATVVANILSRNFIRPIPLVIDLLVVLITGILITIFCNRLRAAYAILLFLSLTVASFVAGEAFFMHGYRMHLVYPIANIILGGMFIIGHRYFGEEKKARDIRKMFSSYVTERVVNELIKNPAMAQMGGDRREVTVLFSDIRGFTTFSEEHTPEHVVALLNEYLRAMTEIVFRWEGTLDKFIGDAIFAFWGAPLPQDNHPELAVRCALNMMTALAELQQKWESEGKARLDIGIGINTGEVLVGNIGSEGKKMEYTAIGDTVNLCSRIESLTKKYHAHILISEHTLERIRDPLVNNSFGHLSVTGQQKVAVKGKERAVKLYAVDSLAEGSPSFILEVEDEDVVKMHEK